ncbi:MAG: chemotaxis protein CheX [Polyangiaceae bacterium]
MHEAATELFDQNLEIAASALFEHLGVEVNFEPPPDRAKCDLACSVGFASPNLRGSLTMTADRAFVINSRPPELRGTAPSELEISDWMGELGNQLLGRLKNRLIGYGVVIDLGTPAVLFGVEIQRHLGRRPVACERFIRSADGKLVIHLDADVSENFEILEASHVEEAMPEGEVALF